MPQLLSSQYLTILQSLQARVQSLDLTFNGNPVSVEIQKIAQWLQGVKLPTMPIILIAPQDKPEDVKPFATEDQVLVKYCVDVVTIAAGNRDNSVNIDVWLNWREQQRRLAQWGLQQGIWPLNSALFGEVIPDPPILRDAALKNYDVSGLGFRIWNVEQRTNNQAPV